MNVKQSLKKGFTLVELLIVIAIIAILSAVVAPNAFKAIEKSKISAVEMDFKSIKTAVLSYYADTGQWPKDQNDSNVYPDFSKSDLNTSISGFKGPYIEKWKDTNPWGGKYIYHNKIINETKFNDTTNAIYITLDNIPVNAALKLKQDIDGNGKIEDVKNGTGEGNVQFSGQVTNDKTIVYILISREK